MAEQTYQRTAPGADPAKLQAELIAAGLPVLYVNGGGDQVYVVTSRELTPAEVTTLDAVIAAHDGRPRRRRKLYDVYQAIGALSPAQKTAISGDLFGGSPPKFTQDEGADAADLLVLWTLQQVGGLSTTDKNLVKQAAAAIYVRDNVTYLVNQTFGGAVAAINVPGDEVIP